MNILPRRLVGTCSGGPQLDGVGLQFTGDSKGRPRNMGTSAGSCKKQMLRLRDGLCDNVHKHVETIRMAWLGRCNGE